jgi:hypothetical protein
VDEPVPEQAEEETADKLLHAGFEGVPATLASFALTDQKRITGSTSTGYSGRVT